MLAMLVSTAQNWIPTHLGTIKDWQNKKFCLLFHNWNNTEINFSFFSLYCLFCTCRYSIQLSQDPALYSSLIVCIALMALLNTKYSIPKTR